MGRRSINTTKSGKYMNPTDQARKEARKKELKKNKRQRQMVRAAVLKGKDPYQIISEMERIDQMEYNVLQPSPLNEKVLKDKRKKLKDTLERVLKMYDKDDPERWAELKHQEADYEKRRTALLAYYESVRHAQQVQIEEIPLPIAAVQGGILPGDISSGVAAQIPLPTDLPQLQIPPPPGILRKRSAYSPPPKPKKPPGVPPGPPPELSDDEESRDVPMREIESHDPVLPSNRRIRFEDDYSDRPPGDEEKNQQGTLVGNADNQTEQDRSRLPLAPTPKPQPTALQQKMLAMAGQDIDQFMREMEEVHRKREADRQADLQARLAEISETGGEGTKDRRGSDGRGRDFRDRDYHEHEFRDRDRDRERDKDVERDFREREERRERDDERETSLAGQSAKGATSGAPASGMVPGGQQPVQPAMPPGPPPLMSLPHMMFRPPPPRLGAPPMQGVRLPPGPPPGRPPSLPPGPPPGLPPRLNMRLPPGPPPGMPPRLMRLPSGVTVPNMPPPIVPLNAIPVPGGPASATPNVLSAAPQLINRNEPGEAKKGATIEAKPQIRNLSADVTRFLPTALRVKRDEKTKKDHKTSSDSRGENIPKQPSVGPLPPGTTKDDAYQQFMREMEGLL